jgi:hypothetical protein
MYLEGEEEEAQRCESEEMRKTFDMWMERDIDETGGN